MEEHKNIRTSFLSKMFPKPGSRVPEIRFKGFSGERTEYKLQDLFLENKGGVSIEHDFVSKGRYKVISIGSYSENSKYVDQGLRVNATERAKDRILNKDDLTMILNDKTQSGNILGRVLLIDKDNEYVYNQRTQRLVVDKL